MSLSKDDIDKLLKLIATAQDDSLDCGNCLDHIAEFAEANLSGRPLPEALQAVRTHIDSCHCCQEEYEALLAALQSIEEEPQE